MVIGYKNDSKSTDYFSNCNEKTGKIAFGSTFFLQNAIKGHVGGGNSTAMYGGWRNSRRGEKAQRGGDKG